jgi:MFS family permease
MTEPAPLDTPEEEPLEGGPWIEGNPVAAARALLVGVFLLMIGNGLQGSLVGVRTETEGFTVTVAGVVMAAYFGGFLAGSRYAEFLLARVGHIRVFAGLASLASTAALVHAVFVNPVTWGLMRVATGLCMAGLFVVCESWLNDLSTNQTRGRMLSLYMVATLGGMTLGQFLLYLADTDGPELFMLSSVLVSAALIPVALSASSNPPLMVPEAMSVNELFRVLPTGIVGAFLNGAAVGIMTGLGAVYAVAVDVPTERIPYFLAAPLFGSLVFQWPIGLLSDRVPRRGVMASVAFLAGLLCIVLAATADGSWLAIGLMAALGATSFPLYSLNIAYTADWLPNSKLTAASAVLVRINGIGALMGPLLATAVIAMTRSVAYFWTMSLMNFLLVGFLVYRIAVVDAPAVNRQRSFVAFPARASTVAIGLMRGQRERPPVE